MLSRNGLILLGARPGRIQNVNQSDAERAADHLGADKAGHRAGGYAGEGVTEDTADGDGSPGRSERLHADGVVLAVPATEAAVLLAP